MTYNAARNRTAAAGERIWERDSAVDSTRPVYFPPIDEFSRGGYFRTLVVWSNGFREYVGDLVPVTE